MQGRVKNTSQFYNDEVSIDDNDEVNVVVNVDELIEKHGCVDLLNNDKGNGGDDNP